MTLSLVGHGRGRLLRNKKKDTFYITKGFYKKEDVEMSKLMTEEKVLKKLGIDDFRHITKSKVIKMASMLDRVDPEVAKKAIEQFPDFSNTAKEILKEYKESLDKSLELNADSVKSYYDACNSIISSLQKEVENENLSFEEKKYFFDQMIEVSKMMGEKDSENKKFIAGCVTLGVVAVTGVVAILGSALGGNTTIHADESDLLDE